MLACHTQSGSCFFFYQTLMTRISSNMKVLVSVFSSFYHPTLYMFIQKHNFHLARKQNVYKMTNKYILLCVDFIKKVLIYRSSDSLCQSLSTVHFKLPLQLFHPLTTTVWPLIIKNINDIQRNTH